MSSWHSQRVKKAVSTLAFSTFLFALTVLICVRNASAESYREQTQRIIDQVTQSAELLKQGKTRDSQKALLGIASSVKELKTAELNYRELANREHDRCITQIGEFERRIGDIFQQEEELKRRINGLDAELKKSTEDHQLTKTEIDKINVAIAKAQESLRVRANKMEELRKWWWVPGYGLYLSIRTLVDNDIGEYKSLVNTLNDKAIQMERNQKALQAAQELMNKLPQQIESLKKTRMELSDMRETVRKRLSELKAMAVFLTETEVFWGKLDGLLTITVKGHQEDLKLLYDMLGKEQSSLPEFEDDIISTNRTLKVALVEFANSLDTGKNFLLKKSTDYCGGPELPAIKAKSVSQRCDIQKITQYFEIVDPKTCSFRYLNPPGCPPSSKNIVVNAETISHARARGIWTRSENQNWVGRNRCQSSDAIYYGIRKNADECEEFCMADSACQFWTFNYANGYMPRSIGECWGAKATLPPVKSDWRGFRSGGL